MIWWQFYGKLFYDNVLGSPISPSLSCILHHILVIKDFEIEDFEIEEFKIEDFEIEV